MGKYNFWQQMCGICQASKNLNEILLGRFHLGKLKIKIQNNAWVPKQDNLLHFCFPLFFQNFVVNLSYTGNFVDRIKSEPTLLK